MKEKLPFSFARLLLALTEREVNYSEFSPASRKWLEQFITDNVLEYRLVGRQQKKISCRDVANLNSYLHRRYAIPSLTNYVHFLEQEEGERNDAVRAASDSKQSKTKVMKGFMVNAYEELICGLNGAPFPLKRIPGTFTLVSDFKSFQIPADVTVVIVENHENFREIERQRYLFEGIRPLFVWRFLNSSSIVSWLNVIPNDYIHFGDFDPMGIHIYLSEFKSKISGQRGRFLIPANVEELLINHGDTTRFEDQEKILPSIASRLPEELKALYDLIVRWRKGLDQEILILQGEK